MLGIGVLDVSPESLLHCRSEQQRLNDELYQQFVVGCTRIYSACINHRKKEFGESREDAIESCIHSLETAPEYSGPCPELLYELEDSKYDNDKSVIARVELREWFMEDLSAGFHRIYKQIESMEMVRSLLKKEPDNLLAVSYEYFHRYRVESKEDLVASTKSVIKMYELDPNCSSAWKFNPNEIVNLIEDLLKQRRDISSTVAKLSHDEFTDLVRAAFDSMKATYTHVYRSSVNIRKLEYAKRLIEHPFIFISEEFAEELGSILDVDPKNYIDRRREFVINDLTKLYVLDAEVDRRHSIGMICNDYAFEIGLAKHCLDLITEFVKYYDDIQRSLPSWLWEAAFALSITASRECDTLSESDVFIFLHCTFCYQTLSCLTDEVAELRNRLIDVFDSQIQGDSEFEYYLLNAYVVSNKDSVQNYQHAINLNDVAILHSKLLSKRLMNKGFQDAAVSVLDIALGRLGQLNIKEVMLDEQDYLGSETCNSSFSLRHKVHDMSGILAGINEMKKVLLDGKTYNFFESGNCALRWNN